MGARQLARLNERLSSRDQTVLQLVDRHRYLTSQQLQRFVFVDHVSIDSAARTTRRVLSRLERDGLLRCLVRRVGGVRAGSSGRIWQLAPAGARLLRDSGPTYRTHEPSPRFLAHCLAVAEVHLQLRGLAERDGVEDVRVRVESDCWRSYSGLGGERRWLQPDLELTFQTAAFQHHWFIEVDLGTESLPTLLRKCGQYQAYRQSGQEQVDQGVFPLVLWAFAQTGRAERLRAAVTRSRRLDPPLYRYTNAETITDVILGELS